ncbi:MAG: hypothetical protein ACLS6C_12295 [Clostridia bacterium]
MEDEAQLNSYITDFTKQELTAAWGEPTESSSMEDVWYINENTNWSSTIITMMTTQLFVLS